MARRLFMIALELLAALLLAATPGAALARRTYIVAIVPAGTGDVYITGDDTTFGPWNPRATRMVADGNKRLFALEAPVGSRLEYKFTLGSWEREALGEDGRPLAKNYSLVVGKQEIFTHVIPGFKGDAERTVYVAAIVPEGTGQLYISGNRPSLGPWNPAGAPMARDGKYRVYALTAPVGTVFEYKFTLGNWDSEALGEDGRPLDHNYRLVVGSQQIYEHVVPGFKARR